MGKELPRHLERSKGGIQRLEGFFPPLGAEGQNECAMQQQLTRRVCVLELGIKGLNNYNRLVAEHTRNQLG